MLIFTSCGWFWDEISRIESVQIMRYAARAMQLARATSGVDLEPHFMEILEGAPSNSREFRNGKDVYLALVEPDVVANARGWTRGKRMEMTGGRFVADRSESMERRASPLGLRETKHGDTHARDVSSFALRRR